MRILTAFALVAALSGVPAAAVVCDLLLCVAPAAQVGGCHDHGARQPGDVVSPADDACTHLADSAPFVAPAAREVNDGPVSVVRAAALPARQPDPAPYAQIAARAGPPGAPCRTASILRI